ncbi:hypothetical protein ACU4HD_47815 [Cupriavidus basilensis]
MNALSLRSPPLLLWLRCSPRPPSPRTYTPLQVSYRQGADRIFQGRWTASKKYDGHRLVFTGQVYPLSDDSLNTLAVTEDLKVGAAVPGRSARRAQGAVSRSQACGVQAQQGHHAGLPESPATPA